MNFADHFSITEPEPATEQSTSRSLSLQNQDWNFSELFSSGVIHKKDYHLSKRSREYRTPITQHLILFNSKEKLSDRFDWGEDPLTEFESELCEILRELTNEPDSEMLTSTQAGYKMKRSLHEDQARAIRVKRLKESQEESSAKFLENLEYEALAYDEEIIQPEESSPFTIYALLDGNIHCAMMVDSGSFANAVDQEFLKINYTENENFILGGGSIQVFDLANTRLMEGALKGHTFKATQGVALTVKFGRHVERISFFIISKQNREPPIILGMPFIKRHWRELDWERMNLKATE